VTNPRNKMLVAPLGTILLIVLATVVFLRPKIAEITTQRESIAKSSKNLVQLTAKVASLEGLDQGGLIEKNDWLMKVVPAEKDVPYFIVTLKNMVKNYDLALTDLAIDSVEMSSGSAKVAVQKKEVISPLSFKISIEGKLSGIKDYLRDVATSLPLMSVDSLELETLGLQDSDTVKASLVLKFYSIYLPEVLGNVDRPISVITKDEERAYESLTAYQMINQSVTELPMFQSGKPNPFTPQ